MFCRKMVNKMEQVMLLALSDTNFASKNILVLGWFRTFNFH